MSYDIYIGKHYFNYTSNMKRFFHRFVIVYDLETDEEQSGLQALNGLTGKEVIRVLERALEDASGVYYGEGRNEFLKAYDAENGGGSTYTATTLLGLMIATCSRNKKEIVRVS